MEFSHSRILDTYERTEYTYEKMQSNLMYLKVKVMEMELSCGIVGHFLSFIVLMFCKRYINTTQRPKSHSS